MPEWTDRHGTKHRADLTLKTILAVKRNTGLELLRIFDTTGDVLTKLSEPENLVFALWTIEDPSRTGAPSDEFIDLFDGDALETGLNFILDSAIDFFPSQRRRDLARTALNKIRTAFEMETDRQTEALNQIDPATLSASVLNSLDKSE